MQAIAIFASGSGTNAANLIRHFSQSDEARVTLVLYNRKDAGVRARAEQLGVRAVYIGSEAWADEGQVLPLLREHRTDLIVLAGFLRLIPPYLLAAYPRRIINIHPSLLPKYGGKGMYGQYVHEAVLAAGERQTGITIHLIDEVYDRGEVLHQATCEVRPDDTPQTLAERVHLLEYDHYPTVIERYLRIIKTI